MLAPMIFSRKLTTSLTLSPDLVANARYFTLLPLGVDGAVNAEEGFLV